MAKRKGQETGVLLRDRNQEQAKVPALDVVLDQAVAMVDAGLKELVDAGVLVPRSEVAVAGTPGSEEEPAGARFVLGVDLGVEKGELIGNATDMISNAGPAEVEEEAPKPIHRPYS